MARMTVHPSSLVNRAAQVVHEQGAIHVLLKDRDERIVGVFSASASVMAANPSARPVGAQL
jgi:hypothetical protein